MTSAADEIRQLRAELSEALKAVNRTKREAIQARPRDFEVLDPTPVEVPVGYDGPPSMRELVQQYVREEVSRHAEEEDLGTFAEEDDFEPEDEDLLSLSGFEITEFPMEDEVPPEPQGEDTPETPSEASGEPIGTEPAPVEPPR